MKTVTLFGGLLAKVDDEDFERISRFRWHIMKNRAGIPYAVRSDWNHGNQRSILMHREILQPAKGQPIDHRNRDGLDNQRANLRLCTYSQNNANMRVRGNKTSAYKGVMFRGKPRATPWLTVVRFNKQPVFSMSFGSELEAAIVYDIIARRTFGEFARVNFS